MEGQQQTRRKGKKSVEMLDRLSELPDPIIHHILALMPTEYAVRTCVLSKKWRQHWTHVHSLNFKYYPFERFWRFCRGAKKFERFVRYVLRCRQPCKLRRLKFHGSRNLSFCNRVFNYAKLHRVEELDTDFCHFPPRFLESQTLTTLTAVHTLPCSLGFAALTTLQLQSIMLASEDIFSSCLKLEDLLLINCSLKVEVFNISTPQLISLTISGLRVDYNYWHEGNRRNKKLLVITAPSLKVLYFRGTYPPLLSLNKCKVLDKVSIQMYPPDCCRRNRDNWKQECNSDIQRMAEGLSHVKSLTISVYVRKESNKAKVIRRTSR
ncbi:F-box/FBD/LRR-repeat protein At3g26920-like [Pistacia vera]|uniref:F-box/FBD/LRR-repeat protein At3g26920-like n=1 Tax=Pistacia vera TaxID=55513 RepID=UPI0012638B64|nr:F-box/FBD/LRR-repeat protein At3g26920-like [Pistacia vera]